MKNAFIVLFTYFTVATLGPVLPVYGQQVLPGKTKEIINPGSIDTTLRVVYVEKMSPTHKLPSAYYVNGQLVNEAFIHSIDPNQIASIDIRKENAQLGNVLYHGQVYIKTKNPNSIKLISLLELKEKYTALKTEPAMFIFDGELITSDYNSYMVDENKLWRIIVDKVENERDHINMNVIKLLTKTEENMKPKIRIRGTEIALKE